MESFLARRVFGGLRLAVALATLLASRGALAADAAACDAGAEREARARLVVVRGVMAAEAQRAVRWSTVWAATGTALAFGNYTRAALTRDPEDRIDPLVSGTASLFIPAMILVKPLRVIADSESVDADAHAAASSGDDACTTLARAEELLARSGEDEAEKAGPLAHAVNLGGNVGIGLLLAVAFHHGWSGLLNGLGGVALGELQIATQPTGLAHARERDGTASDRRSGRGWTVAPFVAGATRGLSLQLVF